MDPIRRADTRARPAVANDEGSPVASKSAEPLIFPGSADPVIPRETPRPRSDTIASADPAFAPAGGVALNFDNADIHNVAKSILGDTLGMNFVVDPRVQGNVTLASTGSISRKDVLPVFEGVLRMSGAAILREGELIKIVPVAEATGTGTFNLDRDEPGFGVSIVPLRYTSAAAVARTAENFLSRSGAIKVDQGRNLLFIQGTAAERQAAFDVVAAFDVEWLRNQSVGVYPLKSTSPETMIRELERVFDSGEGGPSQGLVRFQPISRMNAVMVVTKNSKYLERATQWVTRLDRSDTSGTSVRIYRLKYGSAPKVAKILNDIFVSQRSGGTVADADAPASQIAPGVNAGQGQLDAVRSASATTNAGTAQTPAARIGATFASFETKDRDTNSTAAMSAPFAAGSNERGVFQNVRITPNVADNSIVVYSNQEDYRAIERAVREIDRPRLQVAIEATVAEVTLTADLQFGVQYFFSNNKAALGLLSPNSQLFAAGQDALQSSLQSTFLQRVVPGANLILGSGVQPKVILTALSSLTDVKVLSAPSIVVMDNQQAMLQVGDEIPISTGVATVLTSPNTPVVNSIEMRHTGVILQVLPHVYSNGTIQLEIEQEVSNVVNPTQQTLTPTISERRVHSTVAVTSGQTVLLGGLISDQDQKDKAGIPILNDLPGIGDIFGTKTGHQQRTEIIMFIRPQLIRNSMDARQVAEEFRDRIDSVRP